MTHKDGENFGGTWWFHSRCGGDPTTAAALGMLRSDICSKCGITTRDGPCRRHMNEPLMHLCVACAEPYLALEALRT